MVTATITSPGRIRPKSLGREDTGRCGHPAAARTDAFKGDRLSPIFVHHQSAEKDFSGSTLGVWS